MKKLFTISALALFMIMAMTNHSQAQLKWGLKGGVNFASIKNFEQAGIIDNLQTYTGWHGGIFVQFKLPIVAVQGDILYSVQGQKFDLLGVSQTLENSYILIPVVAKVSLIPLINLQGGLQYGILTTSAINGEDMIDLGNGQEAVKDFFKGGDWSVVLGIGFDISKLMIDARYNLGVSQVNEVSFSSSESLKNGVFQLSAGIKF